MKPEELRIGNIVNDSLGYAIIVNGLTYNENEIEYYVISIENDSYPMEELSPIPLTKEWLERFGFEKLRNRIIGTDLYETWIKGDIEIKIIVGVFAFKNRQLNYVHQLQNLCHALIGEELVCKEIEKL